MTINTPNSGNTPKSGLDFSGFALSHADTNDIRRSAEIARSVYLGHATRHVSKRIGAAYRSASRLFSYTQRMNQAARL